MKNFQNIRNDIDIKLWGLKQDAKKACKQTWKFAIEHPEVSVPIGITLGTAAVRTTNKIINNMLPTREQKIEKMKRMRWYDPSSGIYWDLKRPINRNLAEKIDEMRRQGVPVGEILNRLGL